MALFVGGMAFIWQQGKPAPLPKGALAWHAQFSHQEYEIKKDNTAPLGVVLIPTS